MVSLLVSLSMAMAAQATQAKVPDACRNVAAFDSFMQGATNHTRACADISAGIDAEFIRMRTSAQQAVRSAKLRNGGTQADSLNNVAADADARSETAGDWSKIASESQAKFNAMSDLLAKQVRLLDQETAKVAPALSESPKNTLLNTSAAARKDLMHLQASAVNHASAAGQLSTQFHETAYDLQKYRDTNQGAANRLNGGGQDTAGGSAAAPVAASSGSSKNLLIGLGGAALITAGAVGGLYWVSQKAIKSSSDDAALRIAQAQAAANNVIANAGATATAVITAAQTAAQNIIQFATNSANQIISNAAAAANAIYDKAKADINALKTELMNEVSGEFQYLTTSGLSKLSTELGTMFSDLISRAQAEGNSALAASLQSTLTALQAQIQAEIARRGTSTGTSGTTTSSTSTAVSTDTSTGTVVSTDTSTNTVVRQAY